jgi:hypothetical protein
MKYIAIILALVILSGCYTPEQYQRAEVKSYQQSGQCYNVCSGQGYLVVTPLDNAKENNKCRSFSPDNCISRYPNCWGECLRQHNEIICWNRCFNFLGNAK